MGYNKSKKNLILETAHIPDCLEGDMAAIEPQSRDRGRPAHVPDWWDRSHEDGPRTGAWTRLNEWDERVFRLLAEKGKQSGGTREGQEI